MLKPTLIVFLLLPSVAMSSEPFAQWLDAFKHEARQQGISDQTLTEAFSETQPIDRVIELDRKQPESTMTLDEYVEKTVSDTRIGEGQALLSEHKELLGDIERTYGVPANVIVSLWGIETNYGGYTGNFSTIDALATLAYDGRRSEYFRGELIKALQIIDEDHIAAADMDGSWAGAMGQCQFMPSSFLAYAVDYDGDGKRDIWNTTGDVFASIANYLQSAGWSEEKENNDKVLLKWNRSRYFVAAVNSLADKIQGESNAQVSSNQ